LEYCKAHSHQLISELRELNQAEQGQRIEFLAHEIKRLLQHSHLFPSDSSRVRFLNFLAADTRSQMCESISTLLMKQEMQNLQETWQKNVTRKGYLEGTRGWENFLLLDAPGVPHTSERTSPESMVQIVPPVATRIVYDYEREEREIVRFVQKVGHFPSCS
jgi:hypothetical protein